MANLLIGIAALATIITGLLTLTGAWVQNVGRSADVYRSVAAARGDYRRTSLSTVAACVIPLGSTVRFTIVNDGLTPLRGFGDWSVVATYDSAGVNQAEQLTYVTSASPGAGEWTFSRIFLPSGEAEAFNTGIIDPGEEAAFVAQLSASMWAASPNRVVLATNTGRSLEVTVDGEDQCSYYLHNNPSPPTGDTNARAALVADRTQPGQTTLYNYDADRDAAAGLVIAAGASGPSEADLTKYQDWRTAPLTESLTLAGTVSLDLWAAVKDFNTSLAGALTVYLRDYDGAAYTEIANATVSGSPWDSGATGTFVNRTVSFTGVNYTLPPGNRLEVKIIVGAGAGDSMWLAYDTVSYPTALTLPAAVRLLFHSERSKIAGVRYYQANTSTHNAGLFLHNNPTPPVADTASQADLTLTAVYPSAASLQNYDTDLDAQPGRLVVRGGSGAGESDLTKYQNWRTTATSTPTVIDGTVKLHLWAAVKSFSTSLAGQVTGFLRDYNGSGYTEIASATLTATPWDADATGTWVKRVIEFPDVEYTVPAGDLLEVKVIVGGGAGDDMWLAYDTSSYPASLQLPDQTDPDPAGKPVTLTADGGAATGRFRPSPDEGRFVFPLDGYTRLSDSTWSMTYRVRTPTDPADADIHADIDVLIRKANGDIRTTVATDVASTPNVVGSAWHTVSATFTPAEYTVVDPTDYLEIDLFAHVTRNVGSSAILYFRIDDSVAALEQQTSIGNAAFRRE